MERQGNTGRGARHYESDELHPAVLNGLYHDGGEVVYPEDRCIQCEAEGRLDSEGCWHRHWGQEGTDAPHSVL